MQKRNRKAEMHVRNHVQTRIACFKVQRWMCNERTRMCSPGMGISGGKKTIVKGKETALCLSDELRKVSALIWLKTRSKQE